MLHRDPTPLLRIYGSGRVLLYYSAWSPRAGVYEMRLSTAELDQLVAAIAGNALDVTSSIALAEAAEEAEQESRNLRGELYYSSDSTISELNVYWTNARTEPLLFENLQDTARRHDWQPDINGYADVERALLAIAARKSGVLIAQPTPANELR